MEIVSRGQTRGGKRDKHNGKEGGLGKLEEKKNGQKVDSGAKNCEETRGEDAGKSFSKNMRNQKAAEKVLARSV